MARTWRGALDNGSASLTTASIPIGSRALSAVYQGDPDFAGSSSAASNCTVLVVAAPRLAASTASTDVDGSVVLAATMPPDATGTMTFKDGVMNIASGVELFPNGNALQLDGRYGGMTTNLLLGTGSNPPMTISAWVKLNSGAGGIVSCFDGISGGFNRGIGYSLNGNGHWFAQTGSGAWDTGIAADVGGDFHNVTFVFSANGMSFYRDGVLRAQTSTVGSSTFSASSMLTIGNGGYNGGVQPADGAIDDVCIWRESLGQSDVTALWDMRNAAALVYPDAGAMVAGYHFNEGAGAIAHDFSGNGHDGTLYGSASWTTGKLPDAKIAKISTSFNTIGSHSITAVYDPPFSGDPYGPSTSAALPVLVRDPSLSGLVANAAPNQAAPSPVTDGSLVLPVNTLGGTLLYASGANGNVSVSVDWTPTASSPSYIAATLTLDNTPYWTNTVYYDASTAVAGTSYRITVPIDWQTLPTGCHSYTMVLRDPENTTLATFTGIKSVLDWAYSPFGTGWNLAGLDQLVFNGNNASYVRSDGTMGYFTSSNGVSFAPSAGPFHFMTLSGGHGGDYWLDDPATGTRKDFNSAGQLVCVTDRDGNATAYSYYTSGQSSGWLNTVVDPAGHTTTFQYGSEYPVVWISDFAGRYTRLGFDQGNQLGSNDLTSIREYLPSGPVLSEWDFAYDPEKGMMTSAEDPNHNLTQYNYRNDGTLATATTADSTTVSYHAPQVAISLGFGWDSSLPGSSASVPLALLATSAAVGVRSDQLSQPTFYTLDVFGDATSVENALGQTTAYLRNGNGQVTEMDQPDPATGNPFDADRLATSYTIDADTGMITGQTNPDGSQQYWTYQSYNTFGGQYVAASESGNCGLGAVTPGASSPVNNVVSFTYGSKTYTYAPQMSAFSPNGVVYSAMGDRPLSYGTQGDYLEANSPNGASGWVDWSTATPTSVGSDANDLPDGESNPVSHTQIVVYARDSSNGDLTSVRRVAGSAPDYGANNADIVTDYTYTPHSTSTGAPPAGLLASSRIEGMPGETDYTYTSEALLARIDYPTDADTPPAHEWFQYDAADNLTYHTSALGAYLGDPDYTTSYTYDTLGRKLTETELVDSNGQQSAATTRWSYDALGDVVSLTDPMGNVTTYAYNKLNRLYQVTKPEPLGSTAPNVTTYAYTATGQVAAITGPLGGVTAYTYDAVGNTTSVTGPAPDPNLPNDNRPTTSSTYDALGRKSGGVDVRGYSILVTYYNAGDYVVQSQGAVPSESNVVPSTVYSYDSSGQVLSKVTSTGYAMGDFSSQFSNYQFDNLGRKVQFQDPTTTTPRLLGPTYDKAGNMITNTDAEGNVTNYYYDARNRLIEKDLPSPDGSPQRPVYYYSYDTAGDLLSETDALGHVTTYTYDALGRKITVSLPDPASGDPGGPTTYYDYDLDGNLWWSMDPVGGVTTRTYDAMNNLVAVTDASGGLTSYTYDDLGDMTSQTDAGGNTTTWTYDGLGRMSSETDPLGHGKYYAYDPAGDLTQTIDRDGRVIQYQYDNLGKCVEEDWRDYAGGPITHLITYTYAKGYSSAGSLDLGGTLISAADIVLDPGSGDYNLINFYNYTYNAANQVTNTNVLLPGYSYEDISPSYPTGDQIYNYHAEIDVSQGYDANGDRTSFGVDFNDTNYFSDIYHYDNQSEMTRVTQTSATGTQKRVDLAYDANGMLKTVTRYQSADAQDLDTEEMDPSAAVAKSTYGYDDASRLQSLSTVSGGTTLAAYSLTYTDDGQIEQAQSYADAANPTTWAATTYTYDATDQLVGAAYTHWSATPQPPANFTASYDASGNRSDGGNSSGVGNRMQSDGTFTYQYDAEGTRTRRTRISNASADDYNTEYTWDNRNRLTQITFKNNAGDVTKTIDYTYDMFNRLIAKDISVGGDVHERYVYDGDNLVLVLDQDGNALQENLFGNATDQVFAMETPDWTGADPTQGVRWLLTDNQGTVRDVAAHDMVLAQTSVVDHLVYNAFGKIVSQSDAAEQPRFTYTAQRYDADAGLNYDRARWYDAAAGRFISEDPSGFAAGDVNLNRYVGNNPANGRDPSGLREGFIASPPGGPKIAVRQPDGPNQGDGPLGPFGGSNGRTNMWDGDDFVVCGMAVDPEDFPPLGGDGGEPHDIIGVVFVGLLDTERGPAPPPLKRRPPVPPGSPFPPGWNPSATRALTAMTRGSKSGGSSMALAHIRMRPIRRYGTRRHSDR